MKKVLVMVLLAMVLVVLMSSVALAADDATEPATVDVEQTGGKMSVIVFMAVLVEFIMQRLKGIYEKKPPAWVTNLLSILIGVVLCGLFGVDILKAFGFQSEFVAGDYVGIVATGLFVGGGSAFVHTVLDKLRAGKLTTLEGAVLEAKLKDTDK